MVRCLRSLALGLLCFCIQTAALQAQPDLSLAQPSVGQGRRTSSSDPNWDHGSNDWRTLPSSSTLTIADLTGPGIVTHLWFTFGLGNSTMWTGAPRDIWLSIYWDDSVEPAVSAPIGDFFAVGNGELAAVDSAIVQVGGNGEPHGYNCYWTMPFAARARIVLENRHSTETMTKCYYHVDWIKTDAEAVAGLYYFHARYRARRPLPAGEDYLVADIQAPGRYVGTVFSYMTTDGTTVQEGDERMFIDGDAIPSIQGTGMEDYFGGAWNLHPEQTPYHGVLALPSGGTMYRWHLRDPVPFLRSFRMTFENWGGPPFREWTWTEFSSVAFWYQQDQPSARAATSGEWLTPP